MARIKKQERHAVLVRQIKEKPFLTDEELAKLLEVSIQTIRLDRMELGIPEVRERIRQVAEKAQENINQLELGMYQLCLIHNRNCNGYMGVQVPPFLHLFI